MQQYQLSGQAQAATLAKSMQKACEELLRQHKAVGMEYSNSTFCSEVASLQFRWSDNVIAARDPLEFAIGMCFMAVQTVKMSGLISNQLK